MPFLDRTFSRIKRGGKTAPLAPDDKAPSPAAVAGHKLNGGFSDSHSSSSDPLNEEGETLSKNQRRKLRKRTNSHAKDVLSEKSREQNKEERQEADERIAQKEPAEIQQRYGDIPFVQSTERRHEQRTLISHLSSDNAGQEITFRARVHAVRKMSANLAFIIFRQELGTIQGVLAQKEGVITTHMVQWAERVPVGSIVIVKGLLQKPAQEVKSAAIHDVELLITEFHVVARRPEAVPFTVYEDEISKEKEHTEEAHTSHITDRARLNNRILDLRTAPSKAIFRINSGVCNLFRSYLDSQGFVEIHTPKLQGGATESGSSVFQVDYFGRPAFLAQSPQLAKQMAISADFERVYEIGPVFRAENSNTHRHLTEYTGLDLEMAIEEHYHEALEMIDATLKNIYKGLYERYGPELAAVKRHFPHDDLVWLDETPRIPFAEGVQMLIDSGWSDENGVPPSPYEDLHTRDEIRLGELVKEKFHTDYYILDKFPASARPFYTMPDPNDPKITNSFDLFLRGQEILTGGQRIHDAHMLEQQMKAQGVDPSTMEDYMAGFRYAAPPHAGAGIGLERIVMLILQLGNIRFASLFHRDPKSLPPKPPTPQLRHIEASTLHPPWGESTPHNEKQLQALEDLIANYGDSTNTSWTDDRFRIWRDMSTGAAVSWVPVHGHAILPGNPLCDPTQYTKVASTFLKWLKKQHHDLKPIWVLVGHEMEEVLGTKFGWKTFTCAADERIDATHNPAEKDHDIARKIRHAEKEGIKIREFAEGEPIPAELRAQCDDRIKEWQANRKGKQIHISEINPWRDMQHRRYFFSLSPNPNNPNEHKLHALVILAQLAPRHGYQVKYTLDFPSAPSGTIEHAILHAVSAAKDSGTKTLTFGGAATSELHAVHHLNGMTVKMLQKTYKAVAKEFKLTQKSEFRQKLGGVDDPIFVCYPPHGLGASGSRAVVGFFESDH
ncbi:aspartate--tRNA ligase dps1 [Lecanora helva]